MALLRLPCFQSTSHHFSTQQLFLPTTSISAPQKPPQPPSYHYLSPPPSLSLSTSSSFSNLLYTLPIKTRKPNFFILNVSSSTTIETPEIQQSETLESEEEKEEEEASRTRLLASNIPWSCTPDDLRPLFEKYGTVVSIEEFEGRTMKLDWAKPRKKKPPPPQPKPMPIHNLFVANLPFQARAKDLKEFFNSVTAEIIFHDNPRKSAGYGFVSFNSKAEAEAALSAFPGKIFMERPIRVARSRKFLRQEAVGNTQSENSLSDQSQKADEV